MRKLASMVVAVIAIGLTTCSQRQFEALFVIPFSTARYVMFVNPTFIAPLVTDTVIYSKASVDRQTKRAGIKESVKQLLYDDYRLNVDTSNIFADVVVAVVATMDSLKADSIRKDARFNSVARDVRIQGRPLQQGRPIPLGRPLQQGERVTAAEWGLIRKPGYWLSCAVDKAGGPVDGSTRQAKIWIVDTGIATDNPFLNVDTGYARNFTVSPPTGNAYDDNGHGTTVAGVAASKRIKLIPTMTICASVSPGASVVPIKVLDSTGGGDWSNILHALNYIVSTGRSRDVINMSLGDYPISNCRTEIPGLVETLTNAALMHFIVLAAGNDSDDSMKSVPGCIDGKRLFTVASASCGNQCELFSNYGSSVDFLAVGSHIFTTYLKDPGTQQWTFLVTSGTSISAGIISGLIHSTGRTPNQGGIVYCSNLPPAPGVPPPGYRFGTR